MASLPNTHLVTHVLARLVRSFMRQRDEASHLICFGSHDRVIRKTPLVSRVPDPAIGERATLMEEDGRCHSVPQLAVEVLSPSETRRLTTAKLRDYESIGAPAAWVISPEAESVEILYLEDSRLATATVLVNGILKPRAFPRVEIDIARIWPD